MSGRTRDSHQYVVSDRGLADIPVTSILLCYPFDWENNALDQGSLSSSTRMCIFHQLGLWVSIVTGSVFRREESTQFGEILVIFEFWQPQTVMHFGRLLTVTVFSLGWKKSCCTHQECIFCISRVKKCVLKPSGQFSWWILLVLRKVLYLFLFYSLQIFLF